MDEETRTEFEKLKSLHNDLAGCIVTLQNLTKQHHEAIKRLIELSEGD